MVECLDRFSVGSGLSQVPNGAWCMLESINPDATQGLIAQKTRAKARVFFVASSTYQAGR